MFAAVEFSHNKSRKAPFMNKSKDEICSERIQLPELQSFFTVRVSCRKDKIPWQRIKNYLGVLAHRVVLPENIYPEEAADIRPLEAKALSRLILFNSACEDIFSAESEKSSLYIYDSQGLFKEKIERLVMSFSQIIVVSRETEAYERKARELYEKYGVSLVVTQRASPGCGTAIDPEGSVPSYFSGRVYSLGRRQLLNARVISSDNIILPREYEAMRPGGIRAVDFASALYESCGVKELSELLYENFS